MESGSPDSGDFQPNPIYGDEPATYESTVMPQEDNNDEQYGNHQQQQQEQQQQQPQYEQEYEQQNPPPQYSAEDPGPPAAYSNAMTQNEPEDVVAQMNQDYTTNGQDEEVGDYGVTQPKVSDANDSDVDAANGEGLFGNYFIRTLYMASSLLFVSMLSFGLWFSKAPTNAFKTGLGLSGFAAMIIFFGSIMSIVLAIMTKLNRPIPFEMILKWTNIGLYATGGIFYFFGGCAMAYAYNEFKADSTAGVFFAEQTFVAVHAVLAGIDLWKREILNNKKWRVLAYNVAFFEISLIGFFAYAVTSTRLSDANAKNTGSAFLAFSYFFVMVPLVLYFIVYMIPKLNESLGKPIILLIFAGVFATFVVFILIGYFLLLGDGSIGSGSDAGAYWFGFGCFVLLMGVAIAFDMLFDRFIPEYKDGGSSVSDQQEQNGGAPVPTDNPDYN